MIRGNLWNPLAPRVRSHTRHTALEITEEYHVILTQHIQWTLLSSSVPSQHLRLIHFMLWMEVYHNHIRFTSFGTCSSIVIIIVLPCNGMRIPAERFGSIDSVHKMPNRKHIALFSRGVIESVGLRCASVRLNYDIVQSNAYSLCDSPNERTLP